MQGTIYKITDRHNGLVYIGQTIQTFKRRVASHKTHLKNHTHHNQMLQRVFDKYGIDNFVFETIETCDSSNIDERERFWISFYKSTDRRYGYNLENGGNALKKHSQETIQKFVESSRGKNNKLTEQQVTEIKTAIIDGDAIHDIAAAYNVSDDCIWRIKKLSNWGYVSQELNDAMVNTDTSRKIKKLSDFEIDECAKKILNGASPFNLASEYGIPYKRFRDIFAEEIHMVKQQHDHVAKIVRKMFFSNMSVKEILQSTGISYPVYKRIVLGLDEKRRERNVKYAWEAKQKGKTNPEIAKDLNVNRCTISVYLKEYREKYANTVVI